MNMNTFAVGQPVYNFIMLSLEETASQHNVEVANMLGEEEVNHKWRSSATEELGGDNEEGETGEGLDCFSIGDKGSTTVAVAIKD